MCEHQAFALASLWEMPPTLGATDSRKDRCDDGVPANRGQEYSTPLCYQQRPCRLWVGPIIWMALEASFATWLTGEILADVEAYRFKILYLFQWLNVLRKVGSRDKPARVTGWTEISQASRTYSIYQTNIQSIPDRQSLKQPLSTHQWDGVLYDTTWSRL